MITMHGVGMCVIGGVCTKFADLGDRLLGFKFLLCLSLLGNSGKPFTPLCF